MNLYVNFFFIIIFYLTKGGRPLRTTPKSTYAILLVTGGVLVVKVLDATPFLCVLKSFEKSSYIIFRFSVWLMNEVCFTCGEQCTKHTTKYELHETNCLVIRPHIITTVASAFGKISSLVNPKLHCCHETKLHDVYQQLRNKIDHILTLRRP